MNYTFAELQEKLLELQKEKKRRIESAQKAVNNAFDDIGGKGELLTEIMLKRIDDVCTDCCQMSEVKHLPTALFIGYFDGYNLSAWLKISTKTNIAELIVEEGKSGARLVKADMLVGNNEWTLGHFSGEENQEKDVTDFIDDITKVVEVYFNSL